MLNVVVQLSKSYYNDFGGQYVKTLPAGPERIAKMLYELFKIIMVTLFAIVLIDIIRGNNS